MDTRHISRHARDHFQLESLRFADIASARKIAAQMNVSAGDLYALGLIDEALRILLTRHAPPAQMTNAASFLDGRLGADQVRDTNLTFVSAFPTKPIYEGKQKAEEYLTPLGAPRHSPQMRSIWGEWRGAPRGACTRCRKPSWSTARCSADSVSLARS